MADGRLYDVARAQRALLLSNDRTAASEMVRVYGGIWTRIRRELEVLLQEKIDAEAAGEIVGQSWLYQYDRLERLQRQVLAEMRRFAQYCEGVITQQQQAAINAARLDTERQIRAIANQAGVSLNWVQLPDDVIEDLVGFTANGSPLRDLLEELGKDAMKGIRDALIEGIALGKNPTEIARQARAAFGGDLTRALRVARTEMLRSYREATRRSYEANTETVSGWVWNCACTPRSCAICWALHGTVHQVSEVFGTHPNCRCQLLPVVKPVPGMSDQYMPTSGPEQFNKLEPSVQDSILGKAAGAAYREGKFKLEDVWKATFSKDWGPGKRLRSLKELLG
jgi:SPP1 gp7 family putative phage head morphogenesis protein